MARIAREGYTPPSLPMSVIIDGEERTIMTQTQEFDALVALRKVAREEALAQRVIEAEPEAEPEVVEYITTPEEEVIAAPVLDEEALYGPIGNVVKSLRDHTEASPAAILASLLAYFSAIAGEGSVIYQGGAQLGVVFAAIVGQTSYGRKGTALDLAEEVMDDVIPGEVQRLSLSGAASGEGLVRDLQSRTRAAKGDEEGTGVDGRALVNEPEFTRFLRAMSWKGSTLSANFCKAWDGKTLEHVVRAETLRASGYHVASVVAITKEVLRKELTDEDAQSGFSNRFLWFWSPSNAKHIPFTTPAAELVDRQDIADLQSAVAWSRDRVTEYRRTSRLGGVPAAWAWSPAAKDLWESNYRKRGDLYGLRQAITARADPQVARLALVFAIADQRLGMEPPWLIEVEHLRAAEAVWAYCRQSVGVIFGDSTGNRHADVILKHLRSEDRALTWDDIKRVTGLRMAADIEDSVGALTSIGVARVESVRRAGGGRPRRQVVLT